MNSLIKVRFLVHWKIAVNEKEYKKAASVWELFKIKNLGEYHDLY